MTAHVRLAIGRRSGSLSNRSFILRCFLFLTKGLLTGTYVGSPALRPGTGTSAFGLMPVPRFHPANGSDPLFSFFLSRAAMVTETTGGVNVLRFPPGSALEGSIAKPPEL